MAKPPVLPPVSDEELYRREYASVRPLPAAPSRVPRGPSAGPTGGPVAGKARPSPPRPQLFEPGDGRIRAAAPSVSRETVQALGKGAPPEATCDLHGLRAEAAEARLARFIEDSVGRGLRRVLVVCGRGQHSGAAGPVLRELAVSALTGPAVGRHVLAFASAPPRLGGEGALLVLLRVAPPGRA
jgi:DNA-nicking Smr family endonuclease